MAEADFTIEVAAAGGVLVRLHGEIDDAERLLAVFRQAMQRSRAVEVDLRDVTFIGSRGLSAVLAAREEAMAGGGTLQLVGVSRPVRRLLDITDLAEVLLADGAVAAGGDAQG